MLAYIGRFGLWRCLQLHPAPSQNHTPSNHLTVQSALTLTYTSITMHCSSPSLTPNALTIDEVNYSTCTSHPAQLYEADYSSSSTT
uniref:Uncharacterized protein n=1 Tax=Knipowitschia caucasica TaxID=637954 RepID=A0AAV2K3B6_KNICA